LIVDLETSESFFREMAKIGRNQLCPCGSGEKYKRCCRGKEQTAATMSQEAQFKVSLLAEIDTMQQAANEKREHLRQLGVFILFSRKNGDGWLLEMTDQDAVQIARGGAILDTPIEENPETIEINWSHTFAVKERQLVLTSYEDKAESTIADAPTQQIHAAIKRLHKTYSASQLEQVHLNVEENEAV
jgi:preprotein translocase subunit SecD